MVKPGSEGVRARRIMASIGLRASKARATGVLVQVLVRAHRPGQVPGVDEQVHGDEPVDDLLGRHLADRTIQLLRPPLRGPR